jgi:hypothetical protein
MFAGGRPPASNPVRRCRGARAGSSGHTRTRWRSPVAILAPIAQTKRMTGRIQHDAPSIWRRLYFGPASPQPGRLGLGRVQIGDGEIKVYLLGDLIVRPGRRSVVRHPHRCRREVIGFYHDDVIAGERHFTVEKRQPKRGQRGRVVAVECDQSHASQGHRARPAIGRDVIKIQISGRLERSQVASRRPNLVGAVVIIRALRAGGGVGRRAPPSRAEARRRRVLAHGLTDISPLVGDKSYGTARKCCGIRCRRRLLASFR